MAELPPLRKIWYPVTATLSVDCVQVRVIAVAELTVAERFVGVVGAVVSTGVAGGAETESAAEALPMLPAVSLHWM